MDIMIKRFSIHAPWELIFQKVQHQIIIIIHCNLIFWSILHLSEKRFFFSALTEVVVEFLGGSKDRVCSPDCKAR